MVQTGGATLDVQYVHTVLGSVSSQVVPVPDDKALVIFTDNQTALQISIHPAYHPQTKHIARRFHYTREVVERSTITVQYIHSYWQPTGRHPHSEELFEFV